MSNGLTHDDVDKLYVVSRLVYRGEMAADEAAAKLMNYTPTSEYQNRITFAMYIGMRNGRTFHHSLSDDIIVYFLERIAEDEGKDALKKALNATYGYAGFKNSVGTPLPQLEEACDMIRAKYEIKDESAD